LILLVDAGNSRIKWRLTEGARLVASGGIPSNEHSSLAAAWHSYPASAACICSVLDEERNASIQHALTETLAIPAQRQFWLSSAKMGYGIVNHYQPAESLGPDRFAALIGAHQRQPIDWVVVNVGTAITADLLTADGHFLGGAIAPGPELMRNALARGTAGVNVELSNPGQAIPTDTMAAVNQGIGRALWGVAEGMFRQFSRDSGRQPVMLLSGGAREYVRPFLDVEVVEVDNVVMEGLTWIAQDLGYVV